MLLTRHAMDRLRKRLVKRNNFERIYSGIWALLDRSRRIEVNDRTIVFTDGRKTLVCVKLDCERLPKDEIMRRVEGLEGAYHCVYPDGRLAKITRPAKFVELVPDEEYCLYLNREKRSLHIGREPPLLAITLRPAKKWERKV